MQTSRAFVPIAQRLEFDCQKGFRGLRERMVLLAGSEPDEEVQDFPLGLTGKSLVSSKTLDVVQFERLVIGQKNMARVRSTTNPARLHTIKVV